MKRSYVSERRGKLRVMELAGVKRKSGGKLLAVWRCLCDCGEKRLVDSGKITIYKKCMSCVKATHHRRWFPTPEIDARLREIYAVPLARRKRSPVGVRAYAGEIGWPPQKLYVRAIELGLYMRNDARNAQTAAARS